MQIARVVMKILIKMDEMRNRLLLIIMEGSMAIKILYIKVNEPFA